VADPAVRLPVLLLHGLGCSVEAWGPLLRHIAADENGGGRDRPVWAMDMPGYGKSPGPPAWRALGIEELADWTVRLMDTLGIARAHLAGNSMGCQVALALARRLPERTGALVLCGPTEGADIVPFWRTVSGLLTDAFVEPWSYNRRSPKCIFRWA
jgi:pimeloyl-ACP methyl ester carboxylesterase